MAVSGDVTIARNGGGNVKLHPYIITIIRWCVSCVWSTASVFLHRLVLAPLPAITAPKQLLKPVPKQRQAGTDHLHPEPKVECVVLHTPEVPTLDVIFVHGLYGSLGNTWRQGDWRSKYKIDPQKISLRNHTTTCECHAKLKQTYNVNYTYETNLNETVTFKPINGCFKKILPNENALITENFYDNTLLDVDLNNYETQARFVSELFKSDCNKTCDLNLNENVNKFNCLHVDECKCKINDNCKSNECKCKLNEEIQMDKCKIGCGCVCDECYSDCWPKDWIKEDFPGARVISINYTSDPYLWRPLWVKGNKRLRLHERAEQMMEQLIDLGVGRRPIIWVGHSKGGLFIKEIYCEAYEAYLKTKSDLDCNHQHQNHRFNNLDKNRKENIEVTIENINEIAPSIEDTNIYVINSEKEMNVIIDSDSQDTELGNEFNDTLKYNTNKPEKGFNFLKYTEDKNTQICGCVDRDDVLRNEQAIKDNEFIHISIRNTKGGKDIESNEDRNEKFGAVSSNVEEDIQVLQSRSALWEQSAGFMFYSVPHRGSPLADIKTPITSRSIELLEISKDCQLVLDLQDRWLVATSTSQPAVRSLVETCRTLMSVLWLRIVSVDSADAGVGTLHGVSVDHREICKPSSRDCLLYTELTTLIQSAVNKCDCRTNEDRDE